METKINDSYLGQLKKTKSICIISIVIIFLVSMFQLEHWKKNIYHGDSWGYYSYLPATFIHNDLGDYTTTVQVTQKYDPSAMSR